MKFHKGDKVTVNGHYSSATGRIVEVMDDNRYAVRMDTGTVLVWNVLALSLQCCEHGLTFEVWCRECSKLKELETA